MNNRSLIFIIPIIWTFFMISTTMGVPDCPTTMEKLKGSLVLSQESSQKIKVDWSQILKLSKLQESCITKLEIVIKQDNETQSEEPVKLESDTFSLFTVKPCQRAKVKAKLKIKDMIDYIESASSIITTYKQPEFDGSALSKNTFVTFPNNEQGIYDMTQIHIEGKLIDIVEDIKCRKVVAVKVIVKKDGEDKPISSKKIKNKKKSKMYLDVTLDGSDDFCKGQNVIIELIGTNGRIESIFYT